MKYFEANEQNREEKKGQVIAVRNPGRRQEFWIDCFDILESVSDISMVNTEGETFVLTCVRLGVSF